jgi:hypothetical protein
LILIGLFVPNKLKTTPLISSYQERLYFVLGQYSRLGFGLLSTYAKDLFAKNRLAVLNDMILHNDFVTPKLFWFVPDHCVP